MGPGSIDFGAVADAYARYRPGFPDVLYDRLAGYGVGLRGQTIIDVGTGTGNLARGFARRGAHVIGIDPDERLMAQARRLDAAVGVSVDYRVGRAEAVPLPDASADVVSAGQCWHWFDAPAAAREFHRLARPGGRAVLAYFDWLVHPGNVVEATERLILEHNPSWRLSGGNGFHPEALPHLHAAGFGAVETFSTDTELSYTHEGWRGRIRSSSGSGAALSRERADVFDAALARLLATSFPVEPLRIPYRVFAIVAARGA